MNLASSELILAGAEVFPDSSIKLLGVAAIVGTYVGVSAYVVGNRLLRRYQNRPPQMDQEEVNLVFIAEQAHVRFEEEQSLAFETLIQGLRPKEAR